MKEKIKTALIYVATGAAIALGFILYVFSKGSSFIADASEKSSKNLQKLSKILHKKAALQSEIEDLKNAEMGLEVDESWHKDVK